MTVNWDKEVIVSRIKYAMKVQKLKQGDLLQLITEQNKRKMQQPALSTFLSSCEGVHNIPKILKIAEALHIDLNSLFRAGDEESVQFLGEISSAVPTAFISRADDESIKPYLNKYHVYFFPTISREKTLISGTLTFSGSIDNKETLAKMEFNTGKRDDKGNPIYKVYHGNLIVSNRQEAVYCTLKNEEISEISFLCFHNLSCLNESWKCGVAMVLTVSAGANRLPTAHRMILCQKEIPAQYLEELKGQLHLNSSKVLISEENANVILKSEKMDELSKSKLATWDENGKLKFFCNSSPSTYFEFDEAVIRCSQLDPQVRDYAINFIRRCAVSQRYNKISRKCDEFLYSYLNDRKFFD